MTDTLFEMPATAYRGRRCAVCGGARNDVERPGTVTYALQRQGWVKIGKTTDLEQRVRDLRRRLYRPGGRLMVRLPEGMDWQEPLIVLDAWLGDIEHVLHLRFASDHVTGEWFLPGRVMRRALQ